MPYGMYKTNNGLFPPVSTPRRTFPDFALRDSIPNIEETTRPAHRFLKSIHNIVIEKGWWQLTLRWGHNIVEFYDVGLRDGTYNINDEKHRSVNLANPLWHLQCLTALTRILALWLWSTFVRADLERERNLMNQRRVRKQEGKVLPTGESPEYIYDFPEKVHICPCSLNCRDV